MAGSIYGDLFRISTFGESHGSAMGVIIDGCPAGLYLSEEDIQPFLDRRKPGQSKFSTPRVESDSCKIMSGVFQGKTTGAPIMVMLENLRQISSDYSEIASYYRPGHADYTFDMKYGFRDYRGGGRSSGRETSARVIAGAIASKILNSMNISINAFTQSIGPIHVKQFDLESCKNNPLYMPDSNAAILAGDFLEEVMAAKDSAGGIISCIVRGVPAGIGEPVFDKLDAKLASAIMSIGAIKGVEIGAGFSVAGMSGSMNNDSFYIKEDENGKHIKKRRNNSGGISGGISDGSPIILSAAIKPTASISKLQKTVNTNLEEIDIEIGGRHDPIIVPRAVVVVESMVAITILDLMLKNMHSKLENIINFYKK